MSVCVRDRRRVLAGVAHLVELEHVQQVEELAVLLAVLQLAVVLLQAVQSQLGLVVHKHLHGLKRGTLMNSHRKPTADQNTYITDTLGQGLENSAA